MTTEYAASVRIEDGSLTVTRPHPSIGPVDDLVDSLVYAVRDDSTLIAVEVTVEVADDGFPIGPPAPTMPPRDPDTAQTGSGAPRQPGSPPPADDAQPLSASATGSLNPPVPDPLSRTATPGA